jgi:signal transduction histidine kinase
MDEMRNLNTRPVPFGFGFDRLRSLPLDHGLVLAVLATALGFAARGFVFYGARGPISVLAIAVGLVAVGGRRRWPLAAVFVVSVAIVAESSPELVVGAALVVIYSVAAQLGRRDLAVAGLSVAVAFLVGRSVWGYTDSGIPLVFLALAAAAALGLYVGVRRASMVELERLEHHQETLVMERTAADERVRIARELHDVVAHTLSLIVVQSEVLNTRIKNKELAATAAGVAELGREAMAELHRTLDLLRGADEPAERGPQPSLDDLARLVAQTRDGGVPVDFTVTGQPRPLSAGVEVSAFRIVQEALTNVRRHAAASQVEVRVRYGTDALEISIEDDGAGTGAAGVAEGHGVRGMRERAAMLGGALSVGPLDMGGYRVSVILPYAEV